MSRPSKKKVDRRKRQIERDRLLSAFRLFPKAHFEADDCTPPEFVEIVREAWNRLISNGPIKCSDDDYSLLLWNRHGRCFLQLAKQQGFLAIKQNVLRKYAAANPELRVLIDYASSGEYFESAIFGHIQPPDREAYFPFNEAHFTSVSTFSVEFGSPSRTEITIVANSLPTGRTSKGTVFLSPRRNLCSSQWAHWPSRLYETRNTADP